MYQIIARNLHNNIFMSCNRAQEMKALLYAAVEQAPSADVSEPYVLDSFYGKFDEKFFHYCDKELTKINTFYSGKITFKIDILNIFLSL